MSTAASPKPRLRPWMILAVIFLVGLALRVWGVAAPYQRIDDPPYAKQIYAVFQGFYSPDPQLFYPMAFAYIGGFLLKLIAWIGPLKDFNLEQVLLISRLLSALMGSLTILVVYKIARRLFSESTALAAAAFFSLSFVHILYSHQIVLDVPMTFFYALALYFCVRILQDGRWGAYLAAGFFAGLATATKYNAVFVVGSIFAAHVAVKRRETKNIGPILFAPRLLAAAGVSLAGFIAGHPYAFLWARSFIQGTRDLAKLVHDTEWYLVLIKPQTLLEKLAETKYVKGIGNVISAEGILLAGLVLAGLVWVFWRRRKGAGFIALSGLIYFLGALGFIGFSRLRDLSTLALFYSFFAAFGLSLIGELLKPKEGRNRVFAVLAGAIFLFIGARSFGRVFTLADDDTTAIAERWVRRNVPPKSVIGREWFTPELAEPPSGFEIATRPYLIYSDFPAFDKLDYVMAGSASYGFFYRYAKYYPEQVAVYDKLETKHERIKDVFGREIEFKNPEVKIYGGRTARRADVRLALPAMPAAAPPAREFEVLDGSIYGQDTRTIVLGGGERAERVFLSRAPVGEIAVFVRGAERPGQVVVRSGLKKRKIKVGPGKDASVRLAPARAFPFFKYKYRLRVEASRSIGACVIALRAGDFDIALEDFRSGEHMRASEGFTRAFRNTPPGLADPDAPLYLAACARALGNPGDEKRWRLEFRKQSCSDRLAELYRTAGDAAGWPGRFEAATGIDGTFFSALQTVRLGAAELGRALRLPPQTYAAELLASNGGGAGEEAGTVTVVFREGAGERSESHPLRFGPAGPNGLAKAAFAFRPASYSEAVSFRFDSGSSPGLTFQGMTIAPDLRAFFSDKAALFGPDIQRP
jgi:4-amino-4-deoxy-L-arabinose transferase-like glycosyltransferase